jgi:hypothetical protein
MEEDLHSQEIKDLKIKIEASIEALDQEVTILIIEITHHQEVTVEKGLNQLINPDLTEEMVHAREEWVNTQMVLRSLSRYQGQATIPQCIIMFPNQL